MQGGQYQETDWVTNWRANETEIKKKIKTYYIYMYCRMCAHACVGGVGCDAMFRKKILTTSEYIYMYM